MSFRARLTLSAAVAVAISVAAASAVAYAVVQQQLRGQVDDALRARASAIENALNNFGPPRFAIRPTHDPKRYFGHIPDPPLGGGGAIQLIVSSGESIRPDNQRYSLPVSAEDLAVTRGSPSSRFHDDTVDSLHARIYTVELANGLALQVARPLNEVDHTLQQMRVVLLLVALVGIAIAGGLGMLVAGAALRPVRRLNAATEHVAVTQDLTGRIEVSGHDELSRLAASFNTMLDALERSRRSQQQLVADASHELRTPLTSLRTNIEVLALDRSMPDADRKALLSDVVEQLGEMTALVSELVELARGEHHEAPPEEVRLDLVVDEAVARARRNRPGITFEADLKEATVHGVPGSIERAVSNLLDNAAKWSPEGGTVEVAVDGPQVVVRDHGPGIAEQDLPHVFDRFYRAANARGRPGSGLGLAIVRQVAESHGGSVVAEQPPDGGTRMRLRLEPNGTGR